MCMSRRMILLNLGLHVNDNPESVRENRRRVCEAFDIDPSETYCV